MALFGTSIDAAGLMGSAAMVANEGEGGSLAVTRRRFVMLSGVTGLAVGLAACGMMGGDTGDGFVENEGEFTTSKVTDYVHIQSNGKVVISAPNPDVGQGARTALPMIVASELGANWDEVKVKSAAVDPAIFGSQFAGGSLSVSMRYEELRKMGAMARQMLVSAAAERMDAPANEFTVENSQVVHGPSGERIAFADLADAAGKLDPPAEDALELSEASASPLFGKRVTSVDNRAIVTGKPTFGIDTVIPDMAYAVYVKSPRIGGRPVSANLDEIKAMPGISDAFLLEGTRDLPSYDAGSNAFSSGVAIIAENTWAAIKARRALNVEWDVSRASRDDSDDLAADGERAAKAGKGLTTASAGNVELALTNADQRIEGYYSAQICAHGQLEPENCVAKVDGDKVEVWAPTQTPTAALTGIARLMGMASAEGDASEAVAAALKAGKIKLHQVRGGGGFGRRLENDYVREAVAIARKAGRPVKLVWTREDDMAFDYFRPAMWVNFKAGLSEDGALDAFEITHASMSQDGREPSTGAGAPDAHFITANTANYAIRNPMVRASTPTGYQRAPISNTYGFAEQSFLHEVALAAGRDHLAFLLDMMGEPRWTEEDNPYALHTGRARNVIGRVAQNAGWGSDREDGRALGLSFFFSHAGHVAEIAEVSVDDRKAVKIDKVWAVADIGPVINLSGAEAQVQGSIIEAIGTMAAQKVTFKGGAAQQANYDRFPLARMPMAPEVDVEFLASDFAPTGIGEPALPPLAAAVCNAVFDLTGERIRTLPISDAGFSIV
ncbi:isoquinoline 1-oxidoreductase [Erythrobacter sp. KY5]|uniref:xanthine dehydrogenase family protein molybdopterin-binding subunit n=1 Tax=Erythrobacter sp. KY5 TaxID=2011159 RepID=UPI000DBF2281|nr:molybdopterin cofactor-binding domain-containing protein [Erythrobacter sp. KY5]AWW72925.1 isoquinoline 1-oxidoreductase [Erythrobacter sp. KY5]